MQTLYYCPTFIHIQFIFQSILQYEILPSNFYCYGSKQCLLEHCKLKTCDYKNSKAKALLFVWKKSGNYNIKFIIHHSNIFIYLKLFHNPSHFYQSQKFLHIFKIGLCWTTSCVDSQLKYLIYINNVIFVQYKHWNILMVKWL